MTKKSFFLSWIAALAILLTVSCSKDQTTLNRLKGEWKLTSMTENGVTVSNPPGVDVRAIFEKCKDGEIGVFKTRQTADSWEHSSEYTSTYQVQNDGKIILLDGESVTIVELTHKKLAIDNEADKLALTFEKL